MTEISFYHLTSTPLESALPKLLEKSLQAGFRSVVLLESEDYVESMNNLLWTYDPNSFLPHGSQRDSNPNLQPVYLTCTKENPNNAALLLVTTGEVYTEEQNFARVLDIFDGRNTKQVTQARTRWKHYKEAGHILKYLKQSETGAWTATA